MSESPIGMPDAYLVEYREVRKNGDKRHCTIASMEPCAPTVSHYGNTESRELLKVTPLYAVSETALRGMDSAPKDGTPFLAWVPTYYRGVGSWVVALWMPEKGMRGEGWMDNRAFLIQPTAWMPLPEAPHG